ncbi:MAG: hypothetical protein ACI4TM_06170, partial [Candidatus Cryptobacteroides sp.]
GRKLTGLDAVNRKFNQDLQKQIAGTLPGGYVYQLGMPGEILRAAGFPDAPIEMSSTRLAEKASQSNHIFSISEVMNLVNEINNPIAVFKYGNSAKNVIVGIEHNGKQFIVGIHFNQSHNGLQVSSIRGIFPKDNAEWLNWIDQGKADYLNKTKIQALIKQQRINLADVPYLNLNSVANIVKNFENPKVETRKREVSFVETDNRGRKLTGLDAVNRKFNQDLSILNEKNKDEIILSLGAPSDILLAAGVEQRPMKLYGNKVIKKMKKHGFSLNELNDLPRAVSDPIAVFDNLGRQGNRSILTELTTANGNFLVSIDLGKGEDIDFNIVSSVFGKSDNKISDWFIKGYAAYINKKKALNYLHHSAPIAEALSNSELSSVANIVKNFENPKVETRKREGEGRYTADPASVSHSYSGKRLAAETTADKLGVSVEIVSRDRMPAGCENARGAWVGGKMYVCPENHTDADDVVRTVLHEAVGHNGLRKLVGDKNLRSFLNEVFRNLPESERRKIVDAAFRKYGMDMHEATEEYLASLAETFDPAKNYNTL